MAGPWPPWRTWITASPTSRSSVTNPLNIYPSWIMSRSSECLVGRLAERCLARLTPRTPLVQNCRKPLSRRALPQLIVTEQLRQQDPDPRNPGAPMCSKLVAEIKMAGIALLPFLIRRARSSEPLVVRPSRERCSPNCDRYHVPGNRVWVEIVSIDEAIE